MELSDAFATNDRAVQGASLMVAPPTVSIEQAREVARAAYGWRAPLLPLSGERDCNFLVHVDTGSAATLKFINAAETPQETDAQIRVLEHLAAKQCPVPTPVAMSSVQGANVIAWPLADGQPCRVRAYSYLQGVPLADVPETPLLRQAVGQAAAQLALGLQDFTHPALGQVFLWNVLHLPQLQRWAQALPADAVRMFILQFIPHYEAHTLPRLAALPSQALHGDLSKSNVLVAQDDHTRVVGVLDFGDMVLAPRVVDLGVACSYLIETADAPLQAIAEIVDGYERVTPLERMEHGLLMDIVLARLVQRIVIPEWRARHFPENRAYILRSNAQARQLLQRLMPHWRAAPQE